MHLLAVLLVIGVAAVLLAPRLPALGYWLQRLAMPPEFVVAFTPHGPQCRRGRVPTGWLADCAAVAHDFGIVAGNVDAVRVAGGLRLRFSPEIPREAHQRFRNVFGALAR
jgi:hypothetical protein